jgi:hypothetical protein
MARVEMGEERGMLKKSRLGAARPGMHTRDAGFIGKEAHTTGEVGVGARILAAADSNVPAGASESSSGESEASEVFKISIWERSLMGEQDAVSRGQRGGWVGYGLACMDLKMVSSMLSRKVIATAPESTACASPADARHPT